MNGKRWTWVMLVAALFSVAGSETQAGVTGKSYVGYVVTQGGNLGEVIGLQYEFFTNGTTSAIENQVSGTYNFSGTYTEVDLGIISFWNGVLFDGSPDGQAQISGISLFGGFLSTVHADNLDIGLTSNGFLLSNGTASLSTAQPQSRNGLSLGAP